MATSAMVTNVTFVVSHGTCPQRRNRAGGIAVAAMLLASQPACSATAAGEKRSAEVQNPADEAVANLPFARGKTFRTLDEYLAHLEAQGAVDLPWWREIRPGVYERVTSATNAPREVATRAELMQRFGFRR